MFQVLDNDKPADCYNHSVHSSWNCSEFETLKEAQDYADKWMGMYGPGYPLKQDEEFDYSGYGDVIVIRVV